MRDRRWIRGVALLAVAATGSALAQGGRGWTGFLNDAQSGRAAAGAAVALASNAVVSARIGLTPEQVLSLKSVVTAEKVRDARAAKELAELLVTVLSDEAVATDLELTAAQRKAVATEITPELIRSAFTEDELRDLGVNAGPAGDARAAMRERMKSFDTDGDGRISEEEREAIRERFRRRRGDRGRGSRN